MSECYGYFRSSNTIAQFQNSRKCPGSTQCCFPGDICLSDGICQYTHPQTAAGFYSGYYISGCTDPNYRDSTCVKQCTSNATVFDIMYNYTSSRWGCCARVGASTVDCSKPTGETFMAPAPGMLAILGTSSSASVLSSTSKLSMSTQPANQTYQTSSPSDIRPLPAGTIAGIVVGANLGALSILSFIVWHFLHRRRRKESVTYVNPIQPVYHDPSAMHEKDSNQATANQVPHDRLMFDASQQFYRVNPQELSARNSTLISTR